MKTLQSTRKTPKTTHYATPAVSATLPGKAHPAHPATYPIVSAPCGERSIWIPLLTYFLNTTGRALCAGKIAPAGPAGSDQT